MKRMSPEARRLLSALWSLVSLITQLAFFAWSAFTGQWGFAAFFGLLLTWTAIDRAADRIVAAIEKQTAANSRSRAYYWTGGAA